MIAVQNNGSVASSSVEATAPTYFSQNVGVTFADVNPIADNVALKDLIAGLGQEVQKEDGLTSFYVQADSLAHNLHLIYCAAGEGRKVQVDFDGIYPFDAIDTQTGQMLKFNAQLIMIAEVSESPAA